MQFSFRRTYVPAWPACATMIVLCGLAGRAAAQCEWVQQTPVAAPSARIGHAMVYDSARFVTVLFGGTAPSADANNQTWTWDGTNWTERSSPNEPSPRAAHAMAFDRKRGLTILYGGLDRLLNDPAGSETWTWDGDAWTQALPAASPGIRLGHSMAYDIGRDVVVLFGGLSEQGRSRETWEWDGAAVNWTLKPTDSPPAARISAAMAYDGARGVVVLFGGDVGESPNRETWTYDGGAWTQLSPVNSPSARSGHAMVYDPDRRVVVLFGGGDPQENVAMDDRWEWNGTNWSQVSGGTTPAARNRHTMVYDTDRDIITLFGGELAGTAGPSSETWELRCAQCGACGNGFALMLPFTLAGWSAARARQKRNRG